MKILTEFNAENFLEAEGFPIVPRILAKSKHEAYLAGKKLGFPVVLKVSSDELLHKSEKNAVKLNIDQFKFEKAYDELDSIPVKKHGIIVQKFLHGKYILLGIKKDPTFGHVVVAGLGGIYTEITRDVSMRITPIKKSDAVEMLKELKSYKILEGFRGEKVNIHLIVEQILALSALAEKYPNIKELDINPLIVNEHHARVVDARIVFE